MGSVSASEEIRIGARMEGSTPIVCWFEEVNKDSVPLVGGKCSSLGELINAGVRVPPGFALTTQGYAQFMRDAGIQSEITALLAGLDHQDMDKLEEASRVIREMIESRPMSIELEDLIAESYRKLSVRSCIPAVPVAVRSSATAEDLPGASFAGQQDTYLWIRGIDERDAPRAALHFQPLHRSGDRLPHEDGLPPRTGGDQRRHPEDGQFASPPA
jgi:pyruvate,water dikinase